MLSYQHIYHAGNFADVHKHSALCLVLEHLTQKPKPFAYIDTHAGRGFYDLQSSEAQKTDEAKGGIWGVDQDTAPAEVRRYFENIASCNPKGGRRFYPGSPKVALLNSREQDRVILIEKHPQEFQALSENFEREPRAILHRRDALEGLVALVPPDERRGMVLIDPSYEIKSEYADIANAVEKAYHRWPTGMYMIWYPLLPVAGHQRLLKALKQSGITRILISEIALHAPQGLSGMYGSGIALINPPWQLEQGLARLGQWIVNSLSDASERRARVEWLVPEAKKEGDRERNQG
ncbi:Protein of unknown function (DUF519) [gamma proteobacterium HdN1]|nr:Protein of unknown function (DUF519) [gamma proteobacterium HdN1]